MTYSLPKTGTTTVMRAVGSAGIPCHRCYDGNIDQYHLRDMPTITMVREPVERVISELFEQGFADEVALNHVEGLVLKDLEWFDNHYRKITGINVYGNTFVKKTGYMIYSIRGLVVMTNRMSEVLEKALKEFLPPYFPDADYDSLKVEHRAKGDERFGMAYEDFKDRMKLDKKFLEKVYTSKYCKYFFYSTELKSFYNRWKA